MIYQDLATNTEQWNSEFDTNTIYKINQLSLFYKYYIRSQYSLINYHNVQMFDSSNGLYNSSFVSRNLDEINPETDNISDLVDYDPNSNMVFCDNQYITTMIIKWIYYGLS